MATDGTKPKLHTTIGSERLNSKESKSVTRSEQHYLNIT